MIGLLGGGRPASPSQGREGCARNRRGRDGRHRSSAFGADRRYAVCRSALFFHCVVEPVPLLNRIYQSWS